MCQVETIYGNNMMIRFFLKKGLFITTCLIVGTMLFGGCTSTSAWKHKFKVSHVPGKEIELRGKILKPEGKGPFPAVVLLHGCGGIVSCDYNWANELVQWGYVAFILDSLGPRYKISNCSSIGSSPTPVERAVDAHSAKFYLKGLPFVAHDKIAVMGWSHGGMATANAVSTHIVNVYSNHEMDPFQAGISFYPFCVGPVKFNAPLLVLIGEKDNWTPAEWCSEVVDETLKRKPKHELKLKIYKDAHHRFDCEKFINVNKRGHIMHYNAKAAADSIVQVKQFLDKYLITTNYRTDQSY